MKESRNLRKKDANNLHRSHGKDFMTHCPEHDYCEILYTGKTCPVCEMVTRIDELEDEIAELKDEVEKLNNLE